MSPEQLFPRASRDFLTLLAGLPKHLDAAMPMRRQHRRELPGDIRHLSHLLTDERGDLRRDYLADPAALSAYLRYFLPWNIYRLGVLFAGLALDPGGDNPDKAATIVDLGTGPLTAPLALWMSRPRLRKRPLTFICVDRAPKPMRLGLDVLNSLAAAQGGLAPWKITLVKGPLDARLRERANLLIMANALNEVLHRGEGDLLEDADALAWHLASMLTPTGALCVVEPGIRPSAHLMAALRRGFLHHGLKPLAPCPHTEPCPMSGRGYSAWCHFNFDAEAAPGWLKTLSDEAKLPKDNVSLSFLHFSARGRRLEAEAGSSFVRAVSGPFELPDASGQRRFGQYACSERGLTLLSVQKKHLVPLPGALLQAAWPDFPATDAKSGALVLPLGGDQPTPALKPTTPAPAPKAAPKPEARQASKAAPTLTVDGILAAGETVVERKPKRLPSERPMERPAKAGRKPAARKSGGAPDSDAFSGPTGARDGGKPGSGPAREFDENSDGRPGKKPSGKTGRKTGPKPGKAPGKPSGKPGGKPTGKANESRASRKAAGKAAGKPKGK